MSDWFAKASKLLGRQVAEKIESFSLACPCGTKLSGDRRPVYQRVICRKCGESFFVLPADVYPQPKSRKNARPPNSKPGGRGGGGRSRTTDVQTSDGGSAKARAAPATTPLRGTGVADAKSTPSARRWQLTTRRSTKFRAVIVVMMGVLLATAFLVHRHRTFEQAELTLTEALRAGNAALDADNLDEAAVNFGRAAEAADIMGRDDQQAREIRQTSRELTAATRLVSVSPIELIEQAHSHWKADGPDARELHVKLNFRDKWLVIETSVFRTTGPDGEPRYVVDCPLVIDGKPVAFDAALDTLKPFSPGELPQRIVFAAQIEDCRPSSADSSTWVLKLRRETAFLWTSVDNYRRLGIAGDEVDPQLRQLLDQQGRLVGVIQ